MACYESASHFTFYHQVKIVCKEELYKAYDVIYRVKTSFVTRSRLSLKLTVCTHYFFKSWDIKIYNYTNLFPGGINKIIVILYVIQEEYRYSNLRILWV